MKTLSSILKIQVKHKRSASRDERTGMITGSSSQHDKEIYKGGNHEKTMEYRT